jgi:membrane protein YdbS with pleckstrin-like domain
MIALHTKNKLPALLYVYIAMPIVLVCALGADLLISLDYGTGVSLAGFFLLFLAIPITLVALIPLAFVSFTVTSDEITIDSGMFTRHSKAVPFSRVQNVETVANILERIVGLARINIWTSSEGQMTLVHEGAGDSVVSEPDDTLRLLRTDAEWLKSFIADNQDRAAGHAGD